MPEISEPTANARKAWSTTRDRVAEVMPASTFDLWFAPIEVVGEDLVNQVLYVHARPGVRAWVQRRYQELVDESVQAASDYRGAVFIDRPRARGP